MSTLRLLLCWAFVSSCVLPVLPQTSSNFVCDQFTLDPSVGPENPLIIPEGGSQTITCQHSSIGPQGVSWYRDTSVIREGVADGDVGCSCIVAPLDDASSTREMTFTDFAPESVGPYSCRVPVPFMPGVFNICQFEVQLAELPTVDNLPPSKLYNMSIGSTLTIPASVSGRPFPNIEWRNGSTLLSNNGRVTINGATGALTVTGLTASDRGNYSLTLNNSAGMLTTYISVFVRFADIVDIADPVSMSENRIAVTCSGRAYPSVVVEWQDRSGNTILVGTQIVSSGSTFERTSSNTLTIDRAQCQDPYTCVVRTESRDPSAPSTARPINICSELASLPQPMNVMAVQNGPDSVRVSWTIRDAGLINSYTIIYSDETRERSVEDLPSTALSTTITGLSVGVQYTVRVVSVRGAVRNESRSDTVMLEDCSRDISNKVFGVTIGTAVNTNGERTFNISWMEPQEDIVTGYKVMSDQGWEDIINPKIVTNLLTPANFCNGQDHKFVVMATNNCGVFGPPSATVVGKCDTLSKIKISVKAYSTAITVKWNLRPGTFIQPPLTITVLEIQLNSNGQQLRLNYSVSDTIDEAECLGGLKNSTDYRVCLHPLYTNGMMEVEPVCMDFTTGMMETEASFVSTCTKPESMTLVGSTVNQIPIPDYAIALIVVGALIIVSLVFCFIGICLACNNSRSKNIDDLGSEYSSSIGGGMQGRMSNNHNRNMSPTRSCLSYHSKGHSTNWNDHMGTLREMETEVGTNV